MISKFSYLIYLFPLMLFSCIGGNIPNEVNVVDIDMKARSKAAEIWDKIESIRFVPLETTPEGYLSDKYERVIVNDNGIFILDGKRGCVLRYDHDGKFLNVIEKLGRSGAEYIEASDMAVTSDRIYVYDGMGKKINSYTFSGEYVASVDKLCSGSDMVRMPDGDFAIYSGALHEYALHIFDKDGKLLSESFPLKEKWSNIPSLFSFTTPILESRGELYATNYFDPSIYLVGRDGRPVEYYRFDFGKDNMLADPFSVGGAPVKAMEKLMNMPGVRVLDRLTMDSEWITFLAGRSDGFACIYYNRDTGTYFTNNIKGSAILGVVLSAAPYGVSNAGEHFSIIDQGNVSEAIIPLLSARDELEIPSTVYLDDESILETYDSADNPWMVFVKFR